MPIKDPTQRGRVFKYSLRSCHTEDGTVVKPVLNLTPVPGTHVYQQKKKQYQRRHEEHMLLTVQVTRLFFALQDFRLERSSRPHPKTDLFSKPQVQPDDQKKKWRKHGLGKQKSILQNKNDINPDDFWVITSSEPPNPSLYYFQVICPPKWGSSCDGVT